MKQIIFRIYKQIPIGYKILIILAIACNNSFAQQTGAVSISPDTVPPFESAMLDIKSSDKGLIIPRIATVADISSITSPATGLLIFLTQEGDEGYRYYDGSSWKILSFVTDGYNGKVAPLGSVIMYCGLFDNFDTDGKGLPDTDFEGWAVCNGKNGTPDLRGLFIVAGGTTPVDNNTDIFSTVGNRGGKDSYSLEEEQMPRHTHDMSDTLVAPAHTHQVIASPHTHTIPTSSSWANALDYVKRRGSKHKSASAYTSGPTGLTTGNIKMGVKICDASVNISVSFLGGDKTVPAGQGEEIDNRPVYHVVMYIMKIDETIDQINNLRGPFDFFSNN